MNKFFIGVLCGLVLFMGQANASPKYVKVGDFSIVRIDKHGHFLLDDGNTYKPSSDNNADKSADWQLGNSILVLKSSGKNNYILVNSHTGGLAKMRIARLCT